jgi:hypothetical protein
MFFTQAPQFPTFYTWNDVQRKAEEITLKTIDFNRVMVDHTINYFNEITEKHFTTYTEKASNFNNNVAEDAKKIIKSESKKTKA